VFDMCRSAASELLDRWKEATSGFLHDLKKDGYAALGTFNSAVALGYAATYDHSSVRLSLDPIQPFGNSSLIDGI